MQSQSKNIDFALNIEKIVAGGYGISFHEKEAYLVPFVHPLETVLPKTLRKKKKNVFIVDEYDLLKRSEDRIEPLCDYFGTCGGCHFQMADYKTQIKWKIEILKESFERLTKNIFRIDGESIRPLLSDEWNYRYRTRFQIKNRKIGFFKRNSNELVEIEKCLVARKKINEVLKLLAGLIKESEESSFLETLKTVEVKTNLQEDSVCILFVAEKGEGSKAFSVKIAESLEKHFDTVCIALSLSKTRLPERGFRLLYGNKKIYSTFGNSSFGFSPLSFFQANLRTAFQAYELIAGILEKRNVQKILSLYSGSGVLEVMLGKRFEVLGVEANPYAHEDAVENAFINEVEVQFLRGDAGKIDSIKEVDTVILNPPRSGIEKKLAEVISKSSEVLNVIYLSCNPSTLTRDIDRMFEGGFKLQELFMIDFYPQTAHLEALAVLKR